MTSTRSGWSGAAFERASDLALRLARNETGPMLLVYTVGTLILRLAGNVFLTRLLAPEAFGIMGVITSVMMVLTMLSDFGFASFIIRHEKGDDPKFLDVIWTIRLAQSLVQAVVMAAGALPIALLLHKPSMAGPIALCAPLFVLNALCPMSALLGQRQGLVRKTCAVDLGALGIQIAFNLLLAILLRDFRALIIGLYVSGIARAILTLIVFPLRSHLRFDRHMAREFFGFSRVIMMSTLITLLISQSDKILFARLFNFTDFGVYVLAANLALSAEPFGRNYVLRLFYPMMSRTWRETPKDLPRAFYANRNRMYRLLFSCFGLAIGAAPLLFAIIFDHRYEYGWIFLSILLTRTALDLDSFAGTQTLMAMGRTTMTLRVNLLRLVALALAVFPLWREAGLIGLPVALVVSELAATIYVNLLLGRIGLFRAGPHAVYYGMMIVGIVLGGAISIATVPDVALAAITRIK
jgi:O-antigen/teichoic acid export membrane protein